jgi:hypothetical protein
MPFVVLLLGVTAAMRKPLASLLPFLRQPKSTSVNPGVSQISSLWLGGGLVRGNSPRDK